MTTPTTSDERTGISKIGMIGRRIFGTFQVLMNMTT